MKTDFLKQLGISEQATIDAIMAENGRDIENVKKNTSALEAKIEGLQTQLDERDTQLSELKKNNADNEKLTAKIAELEQVNATAKTEYESKLEALRKTHEREGKVRDAGARNVKAVMALLNDDEDDDKQLATLKESEPYFFHGDTKTPPHGTNPASGTNNTPTNKPQTFADAVRMALTNN